MFEQERLGDDGSSATGNQQLGNGRDEMDGENGHVTHPAMLPSPSGVERLGSSRYLCDKSELATHTFEAIETVFELGSDDGRNRILQAAEDQQVDLHTSDDESTPELVARLCLKSLTDQSVATGGSLGSTFLALGSGAQISTSTVSDDAATRVREV